MWLHLCWRPERETTWGVSPQAAFLLGRGKSPRGRKSNHPESKQQQHSSNQRSRKNCFLSLRVDLCPFLSVGTVCPLVSLLLLRMTCFQSLPFCERSLSFLKFFFFFYFLLLAFAVLYIQGSRLGGRVQEVLEILGEPRSQVCRGFSAESSELPGGAWPSGRRGCGRSVLWGASLCSALCESSSSQCPCGPPREGITFWILG